MRSRLECIVITALAIVLIALWVLGLSTAHTLGGFIHILPLGAALALMLKMFWERRSEAR
jgi:hypothetical protein